MRWAASPTAAASRNMSACKLQAVSHSGWRLMVASSAKISRPRWPAFAAGPSDLTLFRNASISARDEVAAGWVVPVWAGVWSLDISL